MSEAEYLDSIYPYTEEYISKLRELKQEVLMLSQNLILN